MDLLFNSYQTQLADLYIDKLPDEIKEQFYDFINNVPFIKSLISQDRKRACELPKDESGKIIIDVTKPHILEDMDYFRPTALHYKKTGRMTDLRPNANPNSEYGKWIREEVRRCYEGYVRESDGEWITGDYYFFLNYCPMLISRKTGNKKADRVIDFPSVWDGHYLKFHYINQAREHGHHGCELASRGKGKSYSGAALLAKRFILGESYAVNRNVQSVVTASEKKYLSGANQILDMFKTYIDFSAQNTQFPSKRLIDSKQGLQWKMGYTDLDTGTDRGTLNSVIGITSKDDESKLRGSRGVLYLIEEMGTFPRLLNLYNVLRPSVEDGDNTFGLIYMYGCTCAGTKVWTLDGRQVNVEDLKVNDGIVGATIYGSTREPIGTLIEPVKKPCVRIKLANGNFIECSTDHPILKQKLKSHRVSGNKRIRSFYEGFEIAEKLKVGDRICELRKIDVFGESRLFDARLVGMLIGDGSYGFDNTPKYSSEDIELLSYVKNKYDWGFNASHITKSGKNYEEIRIKNICDKLREIGIYGQTKVAKRLPDNYQTLTKEDTINLLGGLFDTDGCVTKSNGEPHICLTQSNREILEQVKILLRKLGITCNIVENKPSISSNRKDKNPWFILNIGGRYNIINFYKNISFLVTSKQQKLEDAYLYFQNKISKKECEYDSDLFIVSKVVSIEDIGEQIVYNLSAMSSHTYLANNIITHNTAGDNESDFASAQEIMYNPRGYNMEPVDNVYDIQGQGRPSFVYFFPGYLNRANCYDDNGNSDVVKAIIEILKDRYIVKYNSSDINSIVRRVAEIPITPQEAILRSRGNLFPVTDLNERLNQLESNEHSFDDVYIGTLVQKEDGSVKYLLTNDTPIRHYPLKDSTERGAIEFYAMPEKTSNGTVPYNRYIIGHDPVDNDQADSLSLTSTFVLDLWTDRIVAEYTGRQDFADENFEIVRKLCVFYNAKCLYESNKKGLFAYFSKMNCTHLLADTPEYLRDKQLIKYAPFGSNAKGVNAVKAINSYADGLTRDWLLKPVPVIMHTEEGDVESVSKNLFFLKNKAFIQELIQYNPAGNFDRIRAFGMLMLYREEFMILYNGQGDGSKNQEFDADYLGNSDFFTKNYDNRFK